MSSIPTWTIPGVVEKARELKTTKDQRIWAYSVTVMALGGTYELQLDVDMKKEFDLCGAGVNIVAEGSFDTFQGKYKFMAKKITVTK